MFTGVSAFQMGLIHIIAGILAFALIGIAGLINSLSIAVKVARYKGLFSDAWLFHGGIPIVCYGGNYHGRLAWRDFDEAGVLIVGTRDGADVAERRS